MSVDGSVVADGDPNGGTVCRTADGAAIGSFDGIPLVLSGNGRLLREQLRSTGGHHHAVVVDTLTRAVLWSDQAGPSDGEAVAAASPAGRALAVTSRMGAAPTALWIIREGAPPLKAASGVELFL